MDETIERSASVILAGTPCTLPETSNLAGWYCTRVEGHIGPCACEPTRDDDENDDTPTEVTCGDIATAAAIALVLSFVACVIWYAINAV